MMVKLKSSWYFGTLIGRLTTALAAAVVVIGLAGGTIWALAIALEAERQSQAVCGLAGDLARTPTHNVTPAITKTGLSFIRDGRMSYARGNCASIDGALPPPSPELLQAYPGIK